VILAQRNHSMTIPPAYDASYERRGARLAARIIFNYASIQYQVNQIIGRNTSFVHSSVGMKGYYIILKQDLLLDVLDQHSSASSLSPQHFKIRQFDFEAEIVLDSGNILR